jgi:hypothetical protein
MFGWIPKSSVLATGGINHLPFWVPDSSSLGFQGRSPWLYIAGVWSYFARTMADDQVNLAADLAQFRADTDAEYVDRFFIPGLRKAGDFRAAAVLNAGGKVLLHNVSQEFPAAWVQEGTEVRQNRLSEADLVAWIAAEASPSRRSARVR